MLIDLPSATFLGGLLIGGFTTWMFCRRRERARSIRAAYWREEECRICAGYVDQDDWCEDEYEEDGEYEEARDGD